MPALSVTISLGDTLSATSADADYDAFAIPAVSGTNTDNDTAGITVTPTTGLITTGPITLDDREERGLEPLVEVCVRVL